MDHTFLVDEGAWRVVGTWTARDGSREEVDGDAKVRHGPGAWEVHARVTVARRLLELRFEVAPWRRSAEDTRWSLDRPDAEPLEGQLVGVADDLLVRYAGGPPDASGVAVLRQVAEHRYQARGAHYGGATLAGTWSLELVRGSW